MNPDILNVIVGLFATQAAAAIDALVPTGAALTTSFIVLSIVLFGASFVTGGAYLAPFLRMSGVAAGTLFAINNWGTIVRETLGACHAALGLILGSAYTGPSALFTLAAETAARVMSEGVAIDWTAPLASTGAVLAAVFVGPLIYLGLVTPALIATGAELCLVVGSICAPLTLPALAFGPTAPLGWGAIRFLVEAGVRVVMVGAVAAISAHAVTAALALGGTDQTLSATETFTLLGVAAFVAILGFAANALAGSVVGGGLGALGLSSFTRVGGVVSGGVSSAGGAVGAAMSAAPAAAARSAAGGMVRSAAGKVGTVSSGSAFGS